jgi:hypothetical protein
MKKIIVSVLGLGMLAVGVQSASATGSTYLSLTPDTSNVTVGDSFTVDIMVNGLTVVEDIKGFDLSINYDISKLTYLSTTLFALSDSDQVLAYVENPVANSVRMNQVSLGWDYSVQGTTDSYKIASITFASLAAGQSGLDFNYAQLETTYLTVVDGEEVEINTNYANGEIVANGAIVNASAAPVPVPAAVWLLGSGLAALGAARRKQMAKA